MFGGQRTLCGQVDESEAIAPAKTVSTEFEQTPPLATVEHLPHPAGDSTLGIVLDTIDMVSPAIRIRVLEHRDQDVQQGVRLELDLTQIGAELIRRGAMDGIHYHQESIWQLTERQLKLVPMMLNADRCEIQQWWQDEHIPVRWQGD